jgi:pSer/pThr/pTyr-binding forkhead associated (FHA) protein
MPKLFILNGPHKGRSFPLKGKEFSIGRSPNNDIPVEGVSVSRRHAKLVCKGDKYIIKDLNSKNGIYINGEKLGSGDEFEVTEGQLISLGKIAISLLEDFSGHESALLDTIIDSKDISENELELLDSMDLSSLVSDEDEAAVQDRPMTSEKNVELIYKVSSVLMQTLKDDESINRILKEILTYVLDLLKRIDRGAFILIDNDTRKISKIIPITKKSGEDAPKMYSKTIVDRVVSERKPVIMLDTLNEDEIDLSESMVSMSIRSVMCVPLISNQEMRGVIYVDSLNRPYGFRSEDLFLLTALSVPAAFAIEKASLSTQ